MENKKNENQTPEIKDELLDRVAGGGGTQSDQDIEMLEFYSEVDRICQERGIHPTDKWRVAKVEEEVRRNRQQ